MELWSWNLAIVMFLFSSSFNSLKPLRLLWLALQIVSWSWNSAIVLFWGLFKELLIIVLSHWLTVQFESWSWNPSTVLLLGTLTELLHFVALWFTLQTDSWSWNSSTVLLFTELFRVESLVVVHTEWSLSSMVLAI